jgi:hypothetical protein
MNSIQATSSLAQGGGVVFSNHHVGRDEQGFRDHVIMKEVLNTDGRRGDRTFPKAQFVSCLRLLTAFISFVLFTKENRQHFIY